jgi:hypothetical protein
MEWREGLLQSRHASSLPVRGRDAQLSSLEEHLEHKAVGVPRAPTSVPVAEPGVMMGLEINTLAMQGLCGGARRCRFVEMRLLKVVVLPV